VYNVEVSYTDTIILEGKALGKSKEAVIQETENQFKDFKDFKIVKVEEDENSEFPALPKEIVN
jgi:outer membrane autotransporter protein